MKEIPTLFVKEFHNDSFELTRQVTPGLEWVQNGEGIATIQWDGVCCAIINGFLFKRYDAKNGGKLSDGMIPFESDSGTERCNHWMYVDENKSENSWLLYAFRRYSLPRNHPPITLEAIGPHFKGNPYGLREDRLVRHGVDLIPKAALPKWDYDCIRSFLENQNIEGIVFWKDGEPQCKIKRTDFGFSWPLIETEAEL